MFSKAIEKLREHKWLAAAVLLIVAYSALTMFESRLANADINEEVNGREEQSQSAEEQNTAQEKSISPAQAVLTEQLFVSSEGYYLDFQYGYFAEYGQYKLPDRIYEVLSEDHRIEAENCLEIWTLTVTVDGKQGVIELFRDIDSEGHPAGQWNISFDDLILSDSYIQVPEVN